MNFARTLSQLEIPELTGIFGKLCYSLYLFRITMVRIINCNILLFFTILTEIVNGS